MSLLKIQRTAGRTVVFTVSGCLDTDNVDELCQLIDAEPVGAVVTLDLTDLVLADRDAVRLLRDRESDERVLLRNCPAYIRAWMASQED
jgi:anti-anti-sigma regulatory factor